MKKIIWVLVLSCFCLISTAGAQLLLVENFTYDSGELLTDHDWDVVQGGIDVTMVSDSGLVYIGYNSSGIGNAALVNPNNNPGHEILAKGFESQTDGDIYVSFLIRAADIDGSIGFNSPFYVTETSGTAAWGRFWVDKNDDQNVAFGLSLGGSAVYTDFIYALQTTYLVVMKYTFNPDELDDEIRLFVFESPTLPASEPEEETLGPVLPFDSEPPDLGRVAIMRAFFSTNDLLLDGIRVARSWTDAPLPVELTALFTSVTEKQVTLSWITASETNNYGFEVERKQHNAWHRVGFVPGYGTTVQVQHYSFVDADLTPGRYFYRLKQIDTDGAFEYSQVVEAAVGGPVTTQLVQNYPNPFNPATNIVYSLSEPGFVSIRIFDIRGRTVRTLINGNRNAGEHSVQWDGTSANGERAASGIYFYSLKVEDGVVDTRRLLMLK